MSKRQEGESSGAAAVAVEAGDFSGLEVVTGESVSDAAVVVSGRDNADAVRTRVRQLRDQMSDGYFEIGRLLHRISRQGLWTHWRDTSGRPYESFKDYVECEVEFAFRKAKHLMSIWWWFAEEVKDPQLPERVKEIGWTKAAMLVGLINSRNADKWLDKAKTLNATQLGVETKKALEKSGSTRRPSRPTAGRSLETTGVVSKPPPADGGDGEAEDAEDAEELRDKVMTDLSSELPQDEPVRGADPLTDEEDKTTVTKWTVMVTGPERANIEAALDEASRIAEIPDGKGHLLDYVSTSFLALHAASGRGAADRQINMRNDILLAVQRALQVDLVVFETGTSHCIFGQSTLERIASELE